MHLYIDTFPHILTHIFSLSLSYEFLALLHSSNIFILIGSSFLSYPPSQLFYTCRRPFNFIHIYFSTESKKMETLSIFLLRVYLLNNTIVPPSTYIFSLLSGPCELIYFFSASFMRKVNMSTFHLRTTLIPKQNYKYFEIKA